MSAEQSKLRWRCRRGMKELDDLLINYMDCHYDSASTEERTVFAQLLELQDPQLMSYMLGREVPAEAAVVDVVDKIRGGFKS